MTNKEQAFVNAIAQQRDWALLAHANALAEIAELQEKIAELSKPVEVPTED